MRPSLRLLLVLAACAASGSASETSPDEAKAPIPPAAGLDAGRVARPARPLGAEATHFTPSFDDRAFWTRLSAPADPVDAAAVARLLADADAAARQEPPALTPELYSEFERNGSRRAFERAFAARTERLGQLVFAEGLRDDGRLLPAIERELAAILDEPAWSVPAHAHGRKTWPEAYDNVELAAATRAWSLATADLLLADRLRPATRERLRHEIRARVLEPFLVRARGQRAPFGWMTGVNNWNPVCNAGVLGAALALGGPASERAEFIAAYEAGTRHFIDAYPDDGFCDEGLGYWSYGFGHYALGAEAVRLATGGRVDLLAEPKVARIATFARRWEMGGGVYAAFGDAGVKTSPTGYLADFTALRFGLGAPSSRPAWLHRHGLGAQLYKTPFDLAIPRDSSASSASAPLTSRDYFPDGGALVLRVPGAASGLAVALKGGHNGQSHNHNDLGSYAVVSSGRLVLADLGMDTYVKDTFGPRRYESGLMNSFGHPVPRVAGLLQRAGPEARAVVLRAEFSDAADVWELDLTSAYEEPALRRLTRTFRFTRAEGGALEIIDRAEFAEPRAFGAAVILRPGQSRGHLAGDRFVVKGPDGGALEIAFSLDDGAAPVVTEDPIVGIVPQQGAKGTRVGIDAPAASLETVLRVTIRPAEVAP